MSKEKRAWESRKKPVSQSQTAAEIPQSQQQEQIASSTHQPLQAQSPQPQQQSSTPQAHSDEPNSPGSASKVSAAKKPEEKSDTTSPSTPDDPRSRPRQVIAVSASKGPAAFFNLARKFLVTDEMCDLSALEGAIVSAADAAHLLERSKLATIVRIQTSYVAVEPKRKMRQAPPSPQPSSGHPPSPQQQPAIAPATTTPPPTKSSSSPADTSRGSSSTVRELRRARIVITVKRTESYKRWLEENPLQAVIAGDGDDGEEDDAVADLEQHQER